eukprot:TRINITY_DN4314_c0_g1_i1.p1 TRINITY_DN4314_c0_g1~~TRINITY_DN4314_c0_g1_i1.p1  ORF type:complete len:268 (+),score=89.61 TRINITY_DN4314_c0_g1_i1:68-871(+)
MSFRPSNVKNIDAAVDPYYGWKDGLIVRATQVKREYDTWKSMMDSDTSTTDSRFQACDQRLRELLKESLDEVRTLGKTVNKVKKKREDFPHIDNAELAERTKFVEDTKSALKKIQQDVESDSSNARKTKDTMKDLKGDGAELRKLARDQDRYQKLEDVPFDEKDGQIAKMQAQQDLLVKEQDEVLVSMEESLKRLRMQAEVIDNELDAQDKMLTALDERVDEGLNRLDINLKKIERLLNTKKRWQIYLIIVLIVILAVLIFVLFTLK